jgi:hypothetical protein
MKTHYVDLSPNEINNRLAKRKLHKAVENSIRAKVLEQKKVLKQQKLHNHYHATLWRELINPAKYERKIIAGMIDYQQGKPNGGLPEKVEALQAYLLVLDKVIERMVERKSTGVGRMPSDFAKELKLPNRAAHWVDWVPEHIKTRIRAMFAVVPKEEKARAKSVFERIDPVADTDKNRARLLARTEKELAREVREQNILPTDKRAERITKMRKAMKAIKELPDQAAVPRTWHGLNV